MFRNQTQLHLLDSTKASVYSSALADACIALSKKGARPPLVTADRVLRSVQCLPDVVPNFHALGEREFTELLIHELRCELVQFL